jgi:hypothetical protein
MAPPFATPREGGPVSKDKKKDKKDKGKKGKDGGGASLAKASKKATKSLQAITQNPLVADVVAAALVAMASALKDSEKAKRLANDAGDQLNALSKKSAKQGNAMWDLALDIGRNVLETLASDVNAKGNGRKSGK